MKKLIILLLLPTGLLAQSSVGISPSKFNLLKDYRIPAWGYSKVQFNLNGELSGDDNNGAERDQSRNGIYLNFAPTFMKYAESENNIHSLYGSVNLYGYYSRSSDKYSYDQ